MDINNLLNVLKHTFSPDPAHRKQAEAYLQQYATQPNFPGMLLQAVTREDGGNAAEAQGIRQAGAITLKNGIKHHWVKHPAFEACYSEADK